MIMAAAPAGAQSVLNAPFGFVDQVTSGQSGVLVSGWVIDGDTRASIDIHVYRDGAFLDAYRADGNRPDVAALHPASGAAHGFAKIYATPDGRHTFCAYGINIGAAAPNTLLGCRSVNVTHDPFGWLDAVQRVPGTRDVVASGWALDADTSTPLRIHVYANNRFAGETLANSYRGDVATAYPLMGGTAAFSLRFGADEDILNVCAYALGVGPGPDHSDLGCRELPPMPPPGSGSGRRIVYANLSQRVWLVGDNGLVDRTYLVSGKYLDPSEGTYAMYAFQRYADAGHDGITMEYFVAFHPAGVGYGFHTIPQFADGTPLQSESELGSFRSSGCVRQRRSDAVYLWNWARYGDPVVLRYV